MESDLFVTKSDADKAASERLEKSASGVMTGTEQKEKITSVERSSSNAVVDGEEGAAPERSERLPVGDRRPSSTQNHGTDLETGKPLGPRDQVALVRSPSERLDACGSGVRRRIQLQRSLSPKKLIQKARSVNTDGDDQPVRKWRNGMNAEGHDSVHTTMHGRLMVEATRLDHQLPEVSEDGKEDEETGGLKVTQYRLTAQSPRRGITTRILLMLGISAGSDGIFEDASGESKDGCACCGIRPDVWVTKYLEWTFRSSFALVLCSTALGFFSLTLIFAGLILWGGRRRPECIWINGEDFGKSANQFGDAYMLSWTTFSTVGYGSIHPSISTVLDPSGHCSGMQILCSLEAFVGVLYAAFCGAIVFGKLTRIRSHAQVTFSDPLVVRYGSGVAESEEYDESSSDGEKKRDNRNLPCPELEFRVINRLHSTKKGEIVNASLNVAACIDQKHVHPSMVDSPTTRRGSGKPRRHARASIRGVSRPSISEDTSAHSGHPRDSALSYHPSRVRLGNLSRSVSQRLDHFAHPSLELPRAQTFDEDPTGRLLSRKVFVKLELNTPGHPFFKRVWTVRHTLNAHSPLLSLEARDRVRQNNGFWPEDLNTHESVRENIHFDHILVSLSGTSNADAHSVYAQHVYDFCDMNVGYRFANVLYRDLRDNALRVDATMINDVLVQFGGGAEPLVVSQQEGTRTRRVSSFLLM